MGRSPTVTVTPSQQADEALRAAPAGAAQDAEVAFAARYGGVTHWDPFERQVTVRTPDVSDIRQGVALPQWSQQLPVLLALGSFVWVFYAIFTDGDVVPATVAVMVSFALVFGLQHLANPDGMKARRRVAFARARGWSYSAERITPKADGHGGRSSERLARIVRAQPGLVSAAMGGLDGEFWGASEADGLPLWLGINALQQNAALAADARLRRDRYGGSGAFGVLFTLVGAYKLDRDTRVRAVIAPANAADALRLREDIETESIAFNEAFRVTAEPHRDGGSAEAAVLRLLTPATQDVLLELLQSYRRIAMIVDGDVLFFRAEDRAVGRNAEATAMDRLLPAMLTDFERAKLSLRRYVE